MIITAPFPRNSTLRRLGRVRELLCQGLDQQLTLTAVARQAALSPGQFIRAFKSVFGQTPHQVRIDGCLTLMWYWPTDINFREARRPAF